MSRIVGLFHRQAQPVDPQVIDRMVQRIDCPEHQISAPWCLGSVGLGHRLLVTTPEALQETLPWTDPDSQVTITADARLDNREQLCRDLDLDPERPDSHVILSAYLKWDHRCPEHLLGDFAFALWDPHQHHLFCARDPFGVKPFYLYESDQVFAFASEIRGLLGCPQVPRRLNELRLTDYLLEQKGVMRPILDDHHSTLYQDIRPLPAAHWIRITPTARIQQRYWSLDPQRQIQFADPRDYSEGFRELFLEAVRCRLRSATPVGIQLSGGLDSSSIACSARQIRQHQDGPPLLTFSAIFPHLRPADRRRLDERPFLQNIFQQGGLDPHLFEADQISPLREGEDLFWHEDECCFTPTTYLNRVSDRWAHTLGCRVMLDGLDGDGVVGHGFYHLRQLAQQGRWLELAIQIRAVVNVHRDPWLAYGRYLWTYGLAPHLFRGPVRRGWQRYRQIQASRSQIVPLLRPEVIQRLDLAERLRAWHRQDPAPTSVRQEQYQVLISGLMQCAFHLLDKSAACAGVEVRHPFFDRRLVEYCLGLPTPQHMQQGWSRWVLRQAMDGILPPSIQWRRGKAKLGAGVIRGFYTQEGQILPQLIQETQEILSDFIQPESLDQAYRQLHFYGEKQAFGQPEASHSFHRIWICVTLAHWLRQTAIRP